MQPPPISAIQSTQNPYKAVSKNIQPPGYPKLVIQHNLETLHSYMKENNSFRRTAINSPPRHSRIFSGPTRMDLQPDDKRAKEPRAKSTLLTAAQTPTDSIMAKYAPDSIQHFRDAAYQRQGVKKNAPRKEVSPVKKQLDTFFSML